jgi:DNA-binding transcriptional ArsR family regulator
MDEASNLAKVGAVLGDPARTAMVLSLMDGSSRAAGELQMLANVSASSASTHLAKLVKSGVLTVTKEGRHKYYRIPTPAVAHAIEAMEIVASPRSFLERVARSPANPFSFARTCYDHLAGKLGVETTTALRGLNVIQPNRGCYEVTERGHAWLLDFGIDCRELAQAKRLLAIPCVDFTERRHHLAGTLGAAILERMVELNWVARSRVPRALRVTERGRLELSRRLKLEFTNGQGVRYRE